MIDLSIAFNVHQENHCHDCGGVYTTAETVVACFTLPDKFRMLPRPVIVQHILNDAAEMNAQSCGEHPPVEAVMDAADNYAEQHGGTVTFVYADVSVDVKARCKDCEECEDQDCDHRGN